MEQGKHVQEQNPSLEREGLPLSEQGGKCSPVAFGWDSGDLDSILVFAGDLEQVASALRTVSLPALCRSYLYIL